MLLLSLRGIKKSFADKMVLKGVDLDLYVRERLGLVGINGSGKTTLANIISGNLNLDGGGIKIYRPIVKMGYLLQNKSFVLNSFEKGFDLKPDTKEQYTDYLILTRILNLQEITTGMNDNAQVLSGGEKTKLALAQIWVHKPDLLILDEPTNHLDLKGIEWLIEEVNNYDGTLLIISHDRYFLDRAANRIVEIEDGRAKSYGGNYTFYREEKARHYQIELHHYQEQKKQEAKIEEEIARLKQWSNKAHRESGDKAKLKGVRKGGKEFYRTKAKKMDKAVKSRIKRIEKLKREGIKKPKVEPTVNFSIHDGERHGRRILEAREITKGYGKRILFKKSSFVIQRGDRIGCLGANGTGKTTLIKTILGHEKLDEGEIRVSPSVKIGYLSQEINDLNPSQGVLEYLEVSKRQSMGQVLTLLVNMGFDMTIMEKRVGQLSMGERVKIKLAKLIIEKAEFLILDEPTNHLDLYSREELERALLSYSGTILIVSHDRYMLEKLCNRLLIFADGSIKKYEGSLKDYEISRRDKPDKEKLKEKLMVIENRLTVVLSQLSRYSIEDEEYLKLDKEFKELVEKKKEIKEVLR